MTRQSIAVATTRLSPSRDERLVPYCLIALGALGATLLAGEPALAALAVPFMLALAVGLRVTGTVHVSARVVLDSEQLLEGDVVTGRIELGWEGTLDARVILDRPHGVATSAGNGAAAWELPAVAGRVELPFELQATRWGRQAVGEVWIQLRAPFGLLTWTGKVVTGPALRVLPASERLTRLLEPPEARAVLGTHVSSRRGDGYEFAELRPYTPGDRLRDLNWGATARHRRPYVNRHHRELSGDVVLAIDAFGDRSSGTTEALARAARVAWALASVHLQANDRVGIAGLGSAVRWLPPASGRRAKYRLLETLLEVGGDPPERSPGERIDATRAVPPSSLVIALTPLHDSPMLRALQSWRARGRSVAVAVIDMSDLLGDPASPAEALARRVWALEIAHRIRFLTKLGIPVVPVIDGGGIGPVVSALRRARRTPVLRTAP